MKAKEQPNLIEPPVQTPFGPEVRQQSTQSPSGTQPALDHKNNQLAQPTGKKSPRPLDQTLRLVAKLDRLLAEMPEDKQAWALSFLAMKYGLSGGIVIRPAD
jgi:hypothetical protein